jgi:hypothetical protein
MNIEGSLWRQGFSLMNNIFLKSRFEQVEFWLTTRHSYGTLVYCCTVVIYRRGVPMGR